MLCPMATHSRIYVEKSSLNSTAARWYVVSSLSVNLNERGMSRRSSRARGLRDTLSIATVASLLGVVVSAVWTSQRPAARPASTRLLLARLSDQRPRVVQHELGLASAVNDVPDVRPRAAPAIRDVLIANTVRLQQGLESLAFHL